MTRNVIIAMVMTTIIAIIIEGTKFLKKRLRLKTEKSIETHKMLMLDYVRCKVTNNTDLKYLNEDFSKLIFQSYMIYIGKMTSSITKTKIHYELEDYDETVFFIDGTTNERNRQTIRRLIKQEANCLVKEDKMYVDLLNIDENCLNRYIEYAISYIEEDLDFQCLCGTLAISMITQKY